MVTPPMWKVCAAIALALLGAAAPNAAAEESAGLIKARAELGDLRYEEALATLGKALEAGTNAPAATAQIHLLLGEVRASLGQEDAAQQAFERALAMDPELIQRKGVSPKLSGPFRRARRARRASARLAIAHRIARPRPHGASVAVIIESDPLGMVAGARIDYWLADGSRRTTETRRKGEPAQPDENRKPGADGKQSASTFELQVPGGVSRFVVAAIDEHGNRLVELGSEAQPLAIDTGGPPPPEPAAPAGAEPPASASGPGAAPLAEPQGGARDVRTPLHAHWLVWGGAAIALGAVGTWAGLRARSAADELEDIRATDYETDFSDAKRVADRADRRALAANLCFAAAGATAVVSAILYIRDRRRTRESAAVSAPAAVTPLVGRDQIGLAASLRF